MYTFKRPPLQVPRRTIPGQPGLRLEEIQRARATIGRAPLPAVAVPQSAPVPEPIESPPRPASLDATRYLEIMRSAVCEAQSARNASYPRLPHGSHTFHVVMTKADHDGFDQWLVDMKHPLAFRAGTQEDRFTACVGEYIQKTARTQDAPEASSTQETAEYRARVAEAKPGGKSKRTPEQRKESARKAVETRRQREQQAAG
jgi:hypothetical protein